MKGGPAVSIGLTGSRESGLILVTKEDGETALHLNGGEARKLGYNLVVASYELDLDRPGVTIGGALELMRAGRRVTRAGWNGKGQFLELQRPDERSKMTLPYIYITTVQGDRVPWLASQTDILAEDWIAL